MKDTTEAGNKKQEKYFTIDSPIPADSCLFGWDVKPGGLFKGTRSEAGDFSPNDPVIIEFKGKNGETVLVPNPFLALTAKAKTLIGRIAPLENNDYMELTPIHTGTPPLIFRTKNARLFRLESYNPPAFDPNAKD